MIIRARAPVRISFAGGGTDVSPYTEDKGGCVLNAAINKYAYCTLEARSDTKIKLESADFGIKKVFDYDKITYDGELDLLKAVVKHFKTVGSNIHLISQVPPKSGLGSSASAFVAVIGAFNHIRWNKPLTDYEIAELAFKLEREELKNAGGRQDQYATVFGGINFMEFKGHDFVKVSSLKLSKSTILELEKNLVIANIGARKASGDILTDQTKRYKSKKSKTVEALDNNKEIAERMKRALLRGDLNSFGNLLHYAWENKKKYSSMISNDRIDSLYTLAIEAGALGGKVSGAGGGGHMIFYCKPGTEHKVTEVLEKNGARVIPFSFDFEGLQTWEVRK